MKRIWKSFVLIAGLVLQMATTVCAQEENVEQARQAGMLQVVVMYSDDENDMVPIQGGSGFLIGDEESGAQYIITDSEVVTVTKDTEGLIRDKYDLSDDDRMTLSTKAVVSRDVMVDLQVVAKSEEMGFYVLKLSQPLFDREPLVLCDDSMVGAAGMSVSSLGYPSAPDINAETSYYVKEDMVAYDGSIIGDAKEDNISYLCHNIPMTAGTLGGPIVDENGHVVGINQNKQTQDGYYALQITEMLPILDALGIPYITTGQLAAQEQAILDAMVHKEDLQAAMETANNTDSSLYYKKTWQVVETALEGAVAVNENEEATQEEVDAACVELTTAMEGLEEKPPVWVTVCIVAAVVVVVAVATVLILYVTRERRSKRKQEKQAEFTVSQAAPVFEPTGVQRPDYREIVKQSENLEARSLYTSGLSEEIGAREQGTTVLSQSNLASLMQAYLVRVRTGEKIIINSAEYVLGKEPSQTDYHIKGNPAISRVHAVIMHQGTEYSIADKNATNGTFVNGVKVAPYQKCVLQNCDKIKLADEEFEFKIGG